MASAVILPGSTVTVSDPESTYRGYKGIVQRLSKDRAAVLFQGGCWDKLVTMQKKTREGFPGIYGWSRGSLKRPT